MIYLGTSPVSANPPGNQIVEAELISGTITGTYSNPYVTAVVQGGLRYKSFTRLELPNCVTLNDSSINRNSLLETVYLPKVTSTNGNYSIADNAKLTMVVLPAIASAMRMTCYNNTVMTTADIGPGITGNGFDHQCFINSSLNLLILRKADTPAKLNNVNAFQGTPFASGGTGGTIYIPKALYDHLGDGTSSDYKAATNWSTVDGYGTITWAQIEGSQYENYYADGTPVS